MVIKYLSINLILFITINSLYTQVPLNRKNEIVTGKTQFGLNKVNHGDSLIRTEKTEECQIFLKNRSMFKDVSITGYSPSSIEIEKKNIRKLININEINRMKFEGSMGFWGGAAIGAGVSMAGWFIVGIAAKDDKAMPYALMFGLASIVPAGLIGGLVAVITGSSDITYDFSNANPDAKLKRLKHIINKHKYWTPMP